MFKQVRFKKRNGREKANRAWQNLPGVILATLLILGVIYPLEAFAEKKPPKRIEFDRRIRVWLGAQDTLQISTDGEMVIECYRDGERAEVYYTSSNIDIYRSAKGIIVHDNNGTLAMNLSTVLFKPRFPNVFLDFENRRYRGFIECDIDKDEQKAIRIFNLIDIELYLKGVLPGEIGERTENEYEAAKAQAVAARTYAVWKLQTQSHDKHIKNSIDDQLYLGANAELPLLNKAVEETEGIIMTCARRPIAAYYHAVCGGSTAPIEKIWGGEPSPYLKGAVDGDYCQWAKVFFWDEEFTISQLTGGLTAYFSQLGKVPKKGFGKILAINFEKDYSIGRMVELDVKTTTAEFQVKLDKIRWALRRSSQSGAILPSTRFNANILKSGDTITGLKLVGAGNGHGIGMCQCGAIGRARAGQKYEEILKTYYSDIEFEKIY